MRRRALPRLLVAAALAAALPACAGAGRHYPPRPDPGSLPEGSPLLSRTLDDTDAWLRHYLMVGHPDSALLLLDRGSRVRPRDELVRHLQLGVVLHHAGRWEESNAAFAWAEDEADSRYTRSLTQAAGALLVNDAAIAYTPPPAEMAMIPYYRMLNYLALGDADATLVEARKAGAYLERLRTGAGEPCVGEGFVQYLAGLVYRGAGEPSDALVAIRQAERAFDACAGRDASGAPAALGADLRLAALEAGVGEVADAAAQRYPLASNPVDPEAGELVLLVEHGWVAHRAHRDIHVPVYPEEMEGVEGDDEADAPVAEAAARITTRLLANLAEQRHHGYALDELPEFQVADALAGAYVMKLAWPVYRLEACAPARVRVTVDGREAEASVAGDLSSAVVRRFQRQRAAMLGRLVARGVAKYLVSREVEKKAEKEGGEFAGWVAGRLANVAGNYLERADTRSWSLLPDRISVVRLTLPAGEHAIRIEVLGPDGAVAETVELGTVTLQPRGTLVLNRRVWGVEMGDPGRLAAALQAEGETQ
ncbi:MAG TPA: hypothetical protein VFX98_07510 [Longimicrobiaceae bacterium]|nr:hypothetical protein [Longimicrobiaceae bacterium]